MKRLSLVVIYLFLTTLASFAPIRIDTDMTILIFPPLKMSIEEIKSRQFWTFADSVNYYESGGICDTINTLGYIGKYQFGSVARKETGYGNITLKEFRKNPNIWPEKDQDSAFVRYIKLNENRLADIIEKYDSTRIHNMFVTKSGILAASHLAGYDNVRKYFNKKGKFNPKDVYGTSLEFYLKRFSGYYF